MTAPAAVAAHDARPARRPLAWQAVPALLCFAAVGIAASRYFGIDGDARIYMARAMADGDPTGLGRDMMFVLDGQSAFSVFPPIAARLVAAFGPAPAALGLAVAGRILWFAAMALLAARFATGRALGVLLVCAAVLPCAYGFQSLMNAREMIAVPRPFAEAGVLLALALLCRGRVVLAWAGLAVAALIHPIMALPGVAVAVVVLGLSDRRWFIAAGALAVAAIAAALAGLPLLARLTTIIDPAWRAVLDARNPYLFVDRWPTAGLGPLAVQSATLLIGALLCDGRPRAILLAALAVGLGGVAASSVFGDRLSLLLVVQAQPWRALWLVAALAMPALGLSILRMPGRGAFGRIALALLALAWLLRDIMPVGPLAAALAVLVALAARTRRPIFTPAFVPTFCGLVLLVAIVVKLREADAAVAAFAVRPTSLRGSPIDLLWQLDLLPLASILSAVAWYRWPRRRIEPYAATTALALVGLLVVLSWDGRSAATRQIDRATRDLVLTARLATRPGDVLWLGPDAEWSWAGRPQWNGFIQGAGNVFSRPLALRWADRTRLLISLGLIDASQLRPWRDAPTLAVPHLTPSALATLCARPDAPAWVVAPDPDGKTDAGLAGSLWHAPSPQVWGAVVGKTATWQTYDTYRVVPCTTAAP